MNPSEFYIENNNVEIEISSGLFKGKYITGIKRIINDYFEIYIPHYKGVKIQIEKDTPIYVSALVGKYKYTFSSSITLVKEEFFYVLIPEVKEIKKLERRQFMRFDTVLEVTAKEFNSAALPQSGFIVNISGGGGLCYFNVELDLKKQYSLNFRILDEDNTEIYAVATLLRVVKEPKNIKGEVFNYAHIFEYSAIDDKYQDKIVKWLLKRHILNQKNK